MSRLNETIPPADARIAKDINTFLSQALIVSGEPTIIFDVGANDGIEAELFARLFPRSQIVAFEARPEAVVECRIRLSSYENVQVVEGACHEVDGMTLPFYPVIWSNNEVGENPGSSSLFKIKDIPESTEKFQQTEIEVQTLRIDTWATIHDIENCDLLWLDIEGAELLALRGMGELLRTVKAAWIETTSIERWEDHTELEQTEVDKYLAGFCLFPVPSVNSMVNDFISNILYLRI